MSNIERFNEVAGRVFAALYENFPASTPLKIAELAGMDEAEVDNMFPRVPQEFRRAEAAITWLRDAGYIWIDDNQQLIVMARLTPKGLEALNSVPASIEPSTSIGDVLLSAVRSGSGDIARELVKEAFRASFRLLAT